MLLHKFSYSPKAFLKKEDAHQKRFMKKDPSTTRNNKNQPLLLITFSPTTLKI